MNHIDGYFYERKYRYNAEQEYYVCPAGQQLHYQNTTAEGYQEFVSDPEICRNCQFLSQCAKSRNHKKVLTRHVWEKYKEQITENRYSEHGKKIYARRKETIEHRCPIKIQKQDVSGSFLRRKFQILPILKK